MLKHTLVSLLCVAAVGATATPGAMAAKRVTTSGTTKVTHTAVKTTTRMQGGATGTGPATDSDCEAIASVINNRMSMAGEDFNAGKVNEGAALVDEAVNLENTGYNAGCFFVY